MTVMRRNHLPTGLCLSAAVALTLGVGLLALSAPARAGDSNDNVPIDTRILRNIMHDLGLKNGYEKPITYEDRPPLVIPPSDALPPPVTSDAAIKNPNWPKDPDVARAKREQQGNENVTQEDIQAWSRPLSPSQMAPYADSAPRYRRPIYGSNSSDKDLTKIGNQRMTPEQLGAKGFGLLKSVFAKDKGDTAQFTGEPPRLSLTEPPPGYQTPSPDQPYGNIKAAAAPKAENYYLDHPVPNMGQKSD